MGIDNAQGRALGQKAIQHQADGGVFHHIGEIAGVESMSIIQGEEVPVPYSKINTSAPDSGCKMKPRRRADETRETCYRPARFKQAQGQERSLIMKRLTMLGALALAGLAGAVAMAKPGGDGKGLAPNQCFRVSDIQNSVQVSETRLNILTNDHRYIRVDTAGSCFVAPFIDPYVLHVRGPDTICTPLDMDLSAGPPGFKTPCIVDKLSQMTPAEVAALPKDQKP
jgi:hypothetical protein